MAIGSLPPVTNEIQANSGQPGKTLAQQIPAGSLLDVQAAAAEPTVAIVPETTLIEKAVAEALGRQGGLAPLYATLAELADAPDLPDAVKAAINQVLAFRLGDGNVTAERVAEAIRSSGLFHEAVAAGRMAAVLPPAVRQALGGLPEEKRQAVPRPAMSVSSLANPSAVARPVVNSSGPPLAATEGPPPNTGAPQAQGGSSPVATAAASPAGASPSSTAGASGQAGVSPGVPTGSSTSSPTAGPSSSATGASAPPGSALASPQAATRVEMPSAGSAATSVVNAKPTPHPGAPSAPAAPIARDGSPPLPAPQISSVDADGGVPAPQSTGGTSAPPSSISPTVTAPAGVSVLIKRFLAPMSCVP